MPIERLLQITSPSPLEQITWPHMQHNVWIKRDDLLHPVISGNKWRKLKPLTQKIQQQDIQHLISFGGGFSNHIHALAYVCNRLNVACTLIIRGDYSHQLTPTLLDAKNWGAKLVFVNKKEYLKRNDADYIEALKLRHNAQICVPEGGTDKDTLVYVGSIVEELSSQHLPEVIILPVGSGGTFAGLLSHIEQHSLAIELIGISVLKAPGYHTQLIPELTALPIQNTQWRIEDNFHQGGYAKRNKVLDAFSEQFFQQTKIPLDSVYNNKSFFAYNQLVNSQPELKNKTVCLLHTGGIQGVRSN
ncbi:1-aminocyclopropane-1-carboxylate deaminase/D-cysteine desulfhydrase [Glaciecola sp. 1036]|uniref:1-aminocyclopropane-1-carboxylate deaminase/D-cysteine desulfhydrase n=1 Tax=Alteromonadaceae TaxID=72275 RepID=UPI003D01FBB7